MKTAYFFMPGLLCLPLLVAAADTIPQDSVTVLGRTLQLVADNGQCILHYQAKGENRSIALKPAPPCFFLRHDKTRPQHFAYPGRKVNAALIVGGTAIRAEQRVDWKLPADQLCGSELQGVLLSGKQIRATRLVMSSGHACKDIGLDEKDFWTFAHEKVEAPASTGNNPRD